jgi:hypothetical protein
MSWGVLVGGGRMNERGKGEGIWLIDFIYLHEIEQRKHIAIALSEAG